MPEATRRSVTGAWIVAVVGLAAGLLASVSTFVPYPGAPAVRAWAGLGAGLWLGGLLTAVLFAWPVLRTRRYRRWRRPAIALLAAFPILAGGWLVVRGIDDPLESGDARVVPAFLAARPGTTVVLTGDSESGIVADAVVGPGPYLGAEALRTTTSARSDCTTPSSRSSRRPPATTSTSWPGSASTASTPPTSTSTSRAASTPPPAWRRRAATRPTRACGR